MSNGVRLIITDSTRRSNKIDPRFYDQIQDMFNRIDELTPSASALVKYIWGNIEDTNSQCFQDLWVLFETLDKKNGFYVEFGATAGLTISNTLLLEKKYGWTGILAEPSPVFFPELLTNRPNNKLSNMCVADKSNVSVEFFNTIEKELSCRKDVYKNNTPVETVTKVKTITLFDLLEENTAPLFIDYLSIDTEGGEFDILSEFFKRNDKYNIGLITVEHNYVEENRTKIFELLSQNGYQRRFEYISAWDDFYFKEVTV